LQPQEVSFSAKCRKKWGGGKNYISFTNSAQYRCLEGLKRESIELFLSYCGIEQCERGHRFGPNNREVHLLHIVLEGKGILEIDGQVFQLEKNDIFYVPKDFSAFYQADYETPWKYLWVAISGIMVSETICQAGLNEKVFVRKLSEQTVKEVQESVEKILETYKLTYANELKRLGELMKLFGTLVQDFHDTDAVRYNHDYPIMVYVNQAIDYMKRNYNKKLKISDVANYVGLNRCYLTTNFRKIHGVSPKQYLSDLRMKKGAAQIKKGNQSIAVIAESVGYKDPLAFSKAFKLHFGVSPREYRKSEEKVICMKKKEEFSSIDK